MFGRKVFGNKEVVAEILVHGVFRNKAGILTKGAVKSLGQLYIRLFGWPDQEIRTTFPKLVKLLEPHTSDSILDVGCGPGVWALEIVSRYGCAVTGIDIDDGDIQFADRVAKISQISNCRFMCMDVTNLSFETESFDKVICMAVLEHIEEDNLAVENMARILRENGVLVGLVPTDIRPRFKPQCWQGSDEPRGHGHVREGYSVQDIETLMSRNGLQLVKYEYASGLIENVMCNVQTKTNQYFAFPFTYPFVYLFSRLSNCGCIILFKAVKRSSRNTGTNKRAN